MMPTKTVVIIRHSESEFNRLNLFCGWFDSPLSDKGSRDSKEIAAANLIKHKVQFDLIYTSVLQRAQQTLGIILTEMASCHLPVIYDWRLTERHYGNLTGFNKRQMADKYGEEQVQKWRRSYEVKPPAITPDNPYYNSIMENPSFSDVPVKSFPYAESMQDTYERVIPAWLEIKQKILEGKRVLIVAHGTVARCLVKHIEGISDEKISNVNLPNSVPCVYEFNSKTGELAAPIKYLADEEYVKKEIQKVASIGK